MVCANALIIGACLPLVTMSIGAAFNAAPLSTNRHGPRAVLVALTALSGAFAAIVLTTLITLAVAVDRAGDAGISNAMRGSPVTRRFTGTPTAQTQSGLIIDCFTILTLSAALSGPALISGKLRAFKPRFCAVHLGTTLLMPLAGVTYLRGSAFPLATHHPCEAIPCALAFVDDRLASTSTAHLTAATLAIIHAASNRARAQAVVTHRTAHTVSGLSAGFTILSRPAGGET